MRILDKLKKVGFSRLTSLDNAISKLESFITPNLIEEINLDMALNRVLATDVETALDIPPFDRSAMDGYALKAADTFRASPKNPRIVKLTGQIEIGESKDLEIQEGEAIRISTGAAIPRGADSVIKIEDTDIDNEKITLFTSIVPGKNVAKKGEDVSKGKEILKKGTTLKSEHLALLVSSGIDTIRVSRTPTVSIFATGNELIEVGNPLEPNKIYNSNNIMLSSLVRLYGGQIIRNLTLKDDKNLIKNQLINAETDSQVIVFSGGTSVGTKDFLPEVMLENGQVIAHGVAMRPGSPILIGKYEGSIVFCLPGTPVAAYIGFLKFVGPTIRKLMGVINPDPRIEIMATIDKDVPVSTMGYVNYLRAKLKILENEFIAVPIKLKGSGIISSITESDGIIEIPPYKEGLKKGEKVMIKLHPQ